MTSAKYTRNEYSSHFYRLGYCCSVDFFGEGFEKRAIYSANWKDPPQYEPEEKTRQRLQSSIDRILTRAELKPVFFVTRSDREDVFEKMLKEMPEHFSICTQTPTSHPPPEKHIVTVWVAHKHTLIKNQITSNTGGVDLSGEPPQVEAVEEGVVHDEV